MSKYTEVAYKNISRGTNVNAGTLPAYRVVGYAASATYGDAVDALSVTTNARMKGVTRRAIAPGQTGDIFVEGSVPIETTAAAVTKGDKLMAEQSTGRVLVATAAAGANVDVVGVAEETVGASGGVIVVRLERGVMQG